MMIMDDKVFIYSGITMDHGLNTDKMGEKERKKKECVKCCSSQFTLN